LIEADDKLICIRWNPLIYFRASNPTYLLNQIKTMIVGHTGKSSLIQLFRHLVVLHFNIRYKTSLMLTL